jgi:hypothetical protein
VVCGLCLGEGFGDLLAFAGVGLGLGLEPALVLGGGIGSVLGFGGCIVLKQRHWQMLVVGLHDQFGVSERNVHHLSKVGNGFAAEDTSYRK